MAENDEEDEDAQMSQSIRKLEGELEWVSLLIH